MARVCRSIDPGTINISLNPRQWSHLIIHGMRIDLVDLQLFMHACEGGSMTAAADRCSLTLAAVSARLRRLEGVVGTALLRRHARGVEPTVAGDALLAHARKVLHEVARLKQGVRVAQAPQELVLLANTSSLLRPLTRLAELVRASPLQLTIRESTSEATVQALHWNVADVGIVSDAVAVTGLLAEELCADPLVIVAPSGHPLSGRASVEFAHALGYDWVCWGDETALGMHLAMQAQRLGAGIRRRVSHPGHAGIVELVAGGFGVAALPLGLLPPTTALGGVCVIPLTDAWARRKLLVCMHPQRANPDTLAMYKAVQRAWSFSPAPL
jgi:DNA-binding transcriptional LysR family regulator